MSKLKEKYLLGLSAFKGYTLEQLGEALGVSASYFTYIVRKRDVKLAVMEAWCKLLNIQISDIMDIPDETMNAHILFLNAVTSRMTEKDARKEMVKLLLKTPTRSGQLAEQVGIFPQQASRLLGGMAKAGIVEKNGAEFCLKAAYRHIAEKYFQDEPN